MNALTLTFRNGEKLHASGTIATEYVPNVILYPTPVLSKDWIRRFVHAYCRIGASTIYRWDVLRRVEVR